MEINLGIMTKDQLKKFIVELEKENKTLKKERDLYKARNEELNENCFGLSKENKKLKSDLAFERTMLDNVKAEYKSLQNVIKKLKDIQEEVKPTQKSKTITVTDEDNRIILEKGEDGKWHSYGGGNVVLC